MLVSAVVFCALVCSISAIQCKNFVFFSAVT